MKRKVLFGKNISPDKLKEVYDSGWGFGFKLFKRDFVFGFVNNLNI